MKLYTEYKKALVDIQKEDKIIKAYFTTFNLSPEFVERYIIPPLYEKEIPKNELHYEEINKAIENSNLDLQFFYDANKFKFDESKRTIAKFNPVLLQNGVFHPKVIYLEGENSFYLFVGSGNLTLSGWGRNIESFRIVKDKKNSNLYNEIWNFFDDVFRVAKLKNSQPRKKTTKKDKINLVYSFDKQSNFIENLHLKKNLQVWSPYFSDIDELINKDIFSCLDTIKIIPDVKDGQKRIVAKKPTDSRISFYEETSTKVSNRFNHSKVWLSDTKIAIGSYNMSQQAIDGINFEAAIIEDIGKDSNLFKIGNRFDIEVLSKDEIEIEYNEDILSDNQRYKGLYKLSANWKTRKFKIEDLLNNNKLKTRNLEVVLPSGLKVSYKEIENLDTNETTAVFSALKRNKVFSVHNSDDVIFKGVIEEIESKGYRDEIKAENLEDIFYFFEEDKKADEKLKEKLEERVLYQSLGSTTNHNQASFQKNYFTMFKGFKKLYKELDSTKDDEKKLHSFCFSSVASLTTIICILEQEKDSSENNLFLYLCIEEINKIITLANKYIKNYDDLSKLKKIENIKLLLTEKDKIFLKACKNV
jgi:hypothetical protein